MLKIKGDMGKSVKKYVVAKVLPLAKKTSLGVCYNLLLKTSPIIVGGGVMCQEHNIGTVFILIQLECEMSDSTSATCP